MSTRPWPKRSIEQARNGSRWCGRSIALCKTKVELTVTHMAELELRQAIVRWQCADKRRYYVATVQRDLFGDIEVWRCWGGSGSRRGGQQVSPVADETSAARLMTEIGRRRISRGYAMALLQPEISRCGTAAAPKSTP